MASSWLAVCVRSSAASPRLGETSRNQPAARIARTITTIAGGRGHTNTGDGGPATAKLELIKAISRRPATLILDDFLWRVHLQVPRQGEIAVFNRSHYEDVLHPVVYGQVSDIEMGRRYAQILGGTLEVDIRPLAPNDEAA